MERNKSIDSVAGMMITYMVFTHVCQHYGYDDSTIYMTLEHIFYFFMPWFFFKAGMFFKIGDNKTILKKKYSRLIRSFIIYSLIGHVCYCTICYVKGDLHLSTLVPYNSLLMQGSIPGNLPLWFLLTLFLCCIVFNAIIRKGCSPYWIAAVSLLIAFALHIMDFKQPFYIANTMTGVFFMNMGYLYARRAKITPQPVRERLFWDVSHRAEPLSRLHLSPSKGIYFFILKFCFMLNNSS